ncbi:MAG: glycosyl hydrolase 53 family protein [Verrucomicrobiota bacterium]
MVSRIAWFAVGGGWRGLRAGSLRPSPFAVVRPSFGWAPATNGFLAGADCSHLQFFESRGAIYRNKGEPVDALQILKTAGLNCVRLRLFTSSAAQAEADPYNYGNNLADTLPLAIRVKRAGLQFMLDFHYSDTWADPGKQTKPAAWKDLSFPDFNACRPTIESACKLSEKWRSSLEYVQIGSETIGGLLWPDGRVGRRTD